MSFSDPQSITIGATTSSLPRTSSGAGLSEYRSSDGLIKLAANNAYGRRTRRVLRLDHSKITSDPFIPTQYSRVSMSNYIVFDMPVAGYTNAEALEVYTGFKSLFTASSDQLITKLLGGES